VSFGEAGDISDSTPVVRKLCCKKKRRKKARLENSALVKMHPPLVFP